MSGSDRVAVIGAGLMGHGIARIFAGRGNEMFLYDIDAEILNTAKNRIEANPVPASMLSISAPDTVHEYCARLIRQLGPEGFILHSGCDIPVSAKLENVRAMAAAATGG